MVFVHKSQDIYYVPIKIKEFEKIFILFSIELVSTKHIREENIKNNKYKKFDVLACHHVLKALSLNVVDDDCVDHFVVLQMQEDVQKIQWWRRVHQNDLEEYQLFLLLYICGK